MPCNGPLQDYLALNVNLTLINEPTVATFVNSAVPAPMQIQIAIPSPGTITVQAIGAITTVPTGMKLLLQVSAGRPPSVTFLNNSMYSPVSVFDEGADLSMPVDISADWSDRYGILNPNLFLGLRANVIKKSNGLRSADFYSRSNEPIEMNYYFPLSQQTAPVSTSGTSVTTLYAYSMPANTLSNTGDKLLFKFSGGFASPTNSVLTFNFGSGAFIMPGVSVNQSYTFEGYIQRVSSSSFNVMLKLSGSYSGILNLTSENGQACDFTNIIAMSLQAQEAVSGVVTGDSAYIDKVAAA